MEQASAAEDRLPSAICNVQHAALHQKRPNIPDTPKTPQATIGQLSPTQFTPAAALSDEAGPEGVGRAVVRREPNEFAHQTSP